MGDEKREWHVPELVALVRAKPEEAVLFTCKVSEVTQGPSPACLFYGDTCAQVGAS